MLLHLVYSPRDWAALKIFIPDGKGKADMLLNFNPVLGKANSQSKIPVTATLSCGNWPRSYSREIPRFAVGHQHKAAYPLALVEKNKVCAATLRDTLLGTTSRKWSLPMGMKKTVFWVFTFVYLATAICTLLAFLAQAGIIRSTLPPGTEIRFLGGLISAVLIQT